VAVFTMGLYASPDYLRRHGEPQLPQALDSLHGLMLLSRSEDAAPWRLSRGNGEATEHWQGLPAQRTLANSPDLLMRMAAAGAGIAVAADFFAEALVKSGALVRVLPAWCLPPGVAWAVFPGRRLMPARTRVFLDALVAALASCQEGDAAPRG